MDLRIPKQKDGPKPNTRNGRFDFRGTPLVSKTAGIEARWKDMKLYTKGELRDIVKVGRTASSGTRGAIALEASSLWGPVNPGAIDFRMSRMYLCVMGIDDDRSVAYAHGQETGDTVRYDDTFSLFCSSYRPLQSFIFSFLTAIIPASSFTY